MVARVVAENLRSPESQIVPVWEVVLNPKNPLVMQLLDVEDQIMSE